MKSTLKAMFAKVATIGLLAGAVVLATPAKAQAQVRFGVAFGAPVYAGPVYRPRYYAPPVVYAPRYRYEPRYYGRFDHDRFDHDRFDHDRFDHDRFDHDRFDRDHRAFDRDDRHDGYDRHDR